MTSEQEERDEVVRVFHGRRHRFRGLNGFDSQWMPQWEPASAIAPMVSGGGTIQRGETGWRGDRRSLEGAFSTRSAECWAVLESLGLSGGHLECHCAGLEGQGGGLDSSPGPARA